jgi:hypothetical protein
MRTTSVNVGLAVFPLVAAQEEPPFRIFQKEKVFSIFLRAFFRPSGKHTKKHIGADRKRAPVQNEAQGCVFDKYRKYRKDEINGKQSA